MASSASNAADYQLAMVRAKAGKSTVEKLRAVGLTVTYDTSTNTATVNLAGKQSFPKGGVLTVSTAIASATGTRLTGSSTFTVSSRREAHRPRVTSGITTDRRLRFPGLCRNESETSTGKQRDVFGKDNFPLRISEIVDGDIPSSRATSA